MAKSTKTDWAWVIAGAGLLAYEAYALANKEEKDTLSERVWRASAKRPLIPFIIGALASHFIWQSQDVYDSYRDEP